MREIVGTAGHTVDKELRAQRRAAQETAEGMAGGEAPGRTMIWGQVQASEQKDD